MNYYNEFDPNAAAWLRQLIAEGLIPAGDVDQRSITDVLPTELSGYTQCHFFCGIGGWSLALALAEWPADRPVWTGSCPCQPFSVAGKGQYRKAMEKALPVAGWPTPVAQEFEGGSAEKMWQRREREKAKGRNGNGFGLTLGMLCGWASPTCQNAAHASLSPAEKDRLDRGIAGLHTQVYLTETKGWATPKAEDAESSGMRHSRGVADTLTAQASIIGTTPSGFPAETANTAGFQLNPFFSLWLMGFPPGWGMAGFRAIRKMKLEQSASRSTASLSARKSRTVRKSSKEPATPSCPK